MKRDERLRKKNILKSLDLQLLPVPLSLMTKFIPQVELIGIFSSTVSEKGQVTGMAQVSVSLSCKVFTFVQYGFFMAPH